MLRAMPVMLVGLDMALDVLGAASGLGAQAQWSVIGVGVAFALAAAATFGLALLLTSAAMLYKAIKGKTAPKVVPESELQLATQSRHWAMPVAFGAVIGVLVTLTSVGAGAIGVSVLMVLYPRLPIARIVAIDIAYAVPLTLLAGLGHASMGSVDWHMLVYLLAGSLPGIWLGSQLVHKAPERLIRSVISLLLAWAGSKLVFL